MSKKFFAPEDFESLSSGLYSEGIKFVDTHSAAAFANAKLERDGKLIYTCSSDINHDLAMWHENGRTAAKVFHKAILINIEPIEKCTYPKEKVSAILTKEAFSKEFGVLLPVYKSEHYKCECGAVVEPKGFEEVK